RPNQLTPTSRSINASRRASRSIADAVFMTYSRHNEMMSHLKNGVESKQKQQNLRMDPAFEG
ncbi:MAG: hypothetical protein ABWX63_06235, partial [Paeniglutamicibacter terrestris]